jgi:hypothetical protein
VYLCVCKQGGVHTPPEAWADSTLQPSLQLCIRLGVDLCVPCEATALSAFCSAPST